MLALKTDNLQNIIAENVSHLDGIIRDSLVKVKKLKEKMNDLEAKISQVNKSEKASLTELLKIESDKLNDLCDSLALESKKSWLTYENLEKMSKEKNVKIDRLNQLFLRCKSLEEIASDLLCYSLGH